MPAPKGSKNALGNKGGGRKSAYQELADATFLHEIWNGKYSEAELDKIIENKNKRYGAKIVWAAKCMKGDDKALDRLVNKLFPDKSEIKQDGKIEFELSNISEDKLNERLRKIEREKGTSGRKGEKTL